MSPTRLAESWVWGSDWAGVFYFVVYCLCTLRFLGFCFLIDGLAPSSFLVDAELRASIVKVGTPQSDSPNLLRTRLRHVHSHRNQQTRNASRSRSLASLAPKTH